MHRFLLATGLILTSPALASAHPGHGATEPTSLSHYLLEPLHAAPFAVVAILTAAITLYLRRRRPARAPVPKHRDA